MIKTEIQRDEMAFLKSYSCHHCIKKTIEIFVGLRYYFTLCVCVCIPTNSVGFKMAMADVTPC